MFKKIYNSSIILLTILCFSSFMSSCSTEEDNENIESTYHSPEELESYLTAINQEFKEITYLEPVGESSFGKTIWALVISDIPLEYESEPRIRLTGSIHGNENITTEILIRFIDFLTSGYNKDQYITELINTRYLVFIPMLNPDGVELESRYNAREVDLNRNFSISWAPSNHHGDTSFSELESASIRDYSLYMQFHSSLSFHSGAVVVNVPFDYASRFNGGDCPLEYDLVEYLAKVYSKSGKFLETPGILNNTHVDEGIINGGDWFYAFGTMQDWSYLQSGCLDFTIEISNEKKPESFKKIDEIYQYNEESILAFIDASGMGLYGQITDTDSKPVLAEIIIDDGDIITTQISFSMWLRLIRNSCILLQIII